MSYTQEEKRILETEQLYNMQKMQLFQLMNATDVSIKEVILVSNAFDETTSVSTEISNPKIKSAELNYKSSLKELSSQRASNLPVLSSFYSISSFYYKSLNQSNTNVASFSNQIGDNKNQQVGVQLSVPIFNGFRNNKKNIVAKIETEIFI